MTIVIDASSILGLFFWLSAIHCGGLFGRCFWCPILGQSLQHSIAH